MASHDLLIRYKNLLIILARYQVALAKGAAAIREAAAAEQHNGRFAGLNCKARAISKQAKSLEVIIGRNSAALRYFFGTTKVKEIAGHPIEYGPDILLTHKTQELQ